MERKYEIDDLPGEIWADIKGYEGLYSISNMGRVRSEEREVLALYGIIRKIKAKIKKTSNHGKYIRSKSGIGVLTTLLHKDGVGETCIVSRLVWNHFCGGDIPAGYIVGYKNGNQHDVTANNLCLKTISEKGIDANNEDFSTPVAMLDKAGTQIRVFRSMGAAARRIAKDSPSVKVNPICCKIWRCCNGSTKLCYGYRRKYLDPKPTTGI